MAGQALAANWPDLLEVDIRTVYIDKYKDLPAMTPDQITLNSLGKSARSNEHKGTIRRIHSPSIPH
jgi:hypothetical protein